MDKMQKDPNRILRTGKHTIDRKILVKYALPLAKEMCAESMEQDLIMASEFILDVDSLLERLDSVPAFLVEEDVDIKNYDWVHRSTITIIYKQPDDDKKDEK
jgi:hypothetical protein